MIIVYNYLDTVRFFIFYLYLDSFLHVNSIDLLVLMLSFRFNGNYINQTIIEVHFNIPLVLVSIGIL